MFLATFALMAALAPVGDDKKTIVLPHAWPAGTSYHIEFTKTREEIEAGQPTKVESTHTPIDVEVLARRDDGFTVRWTHGKPVLATDVAIVDKVAAFVEGLKMEFIADATGSATKLANPLAIETHLETQSKALLLKLASSKTLAPDEVESVRAAVATLRAQTFQASIMFYMPSGASLVLGEKRTYEDHLPNPFGGEPLPSQAYLELRSVRADANEATVEWRQTIDPTRAGPILEASIRALAKRTGRELPGGASLSFDAIEDAATYVYDLATGVPKSVTVTRTTTLAGVRRIDTQRFDVTWPKPK